MLSCYICGVSGLPILRDDECVLMLLQASPQDPLHSSVGDELQEAFIDWAPHAAILTGVVNYKGLFEPHDTPLNRKAILYYMAHKMQVLTGPTHLFPDKAEVIKLLAGADPGMIADPALGAWDDYRTLWDRFNVGLLSRSWGIKYGESVRPVSFSIFHAGAVDLCRESDILGAGWNTSPPVAAFVKGVQEAKAKLSGNPPVLTNPWLINIYPVFEKVGISEELRRVLCPFRDDFVSIICSAEDEGLSDDEVCTKLLPYFDAVCLLFGLSRAGRSLAPSRRTNHPAGVFLQTLRMSLFMALELEGRAAGSHGYKSTKHIRKKLFDDIFRGFW